MDQVRGRVDQVFRRRLLRLWKAVASRLVLLLGRVVGCVGRGWEGSRSREQRCASRKKDGGLGSNSGHRGYVGCGDEPYGENKQLNRKTVAADGPGDRSEFINYIRGGCSVLAVWESGPSL